MTAPTATGGTRATRPGRPERKKRRASLAVLFPGQAVEVRKLNRHWGVVRLPKIGWTRFRMSRPLGGELRNATVTVNGAGEWHVSFGVAAGREAAPPNGMPGRRMREPLAGAA